MKIRKKIDEWMKAAAPEVCIDVTYGLTSADRSGIYRSGTI
jgi:hypothetical protein